MVATAQEFPLCILKNLKCCGFQPFANGPYQGCTSGRYQGAYGFTCTQATLATHSHV